MNHCNCHSVFLFFLNFYLFLLKWNVYLRGLCKSIAYKIYSLGKLSKYLNSKLLNILYRCIVQPCIDYAISVWANCPASYKLPLQRLQKRAARYVTGILDYEIASGNTLVKQLPWQTVDQRRDYFLATLMFKCIRGIAPPRLSNEIEMYFDRHGFNTRNANSLNVVLPQPNLTLFKQSFRYAGAVTWNKLSNDEQNANSIDIFKHLYKKKFLS